MAVHASANRAIAAGMSEPEDAIAAALAEAGLAERLVSSRVKQGIATLLFDATGLSAEESAGLERKARAAMIGVPGVIDARVAMTAEKAKRTIVAVASGKGGVGKSTLAANLAVALARMGRRVGLVDADIYGPSQPSLMGQQARPELNGEKIVPTPAHGV